ncbi:MAG: biopolymer transporter ExbD [Saprospiraceae bacterium]|nr:biopolymer transporter ExbD [Saprospiraceae bacterium]
MLKKKKNHRMRNEINAGSMADIAFLLLIFFLVTTQISEDKGLLVKLPPWSTEPPPDFKANSRNLYSVLVNAQNQLLVRGQPMDIEKLRENTKLFISNPRQESDKATNPADAIVSLKNDRGTKYSTYLRVYNELQAAYTELRNETALKKYGKDFEFVTDTQKKEIRELIPLILSEAEPTAFGDEK